MSEKNFASEVLTRAAFLIYYLFALFLVVVFTSLAHVVLFFLYAIGGAIPAFIMFAAVGLVFGIFNGTGMMYVPDTAYDGTVLVMMALASFHVVQFLQSLTTVLPRFHRESMEKLNKSLNG